MVRARRPRSAPRPLRRALALVAVAFAGSAASAAMALAIPAAVQAGPAAGAQGRIVGGVETSIRTVPWQVNVWSRGGEDGGFDCGGSILGPTTVVTAAHCVDGAAVGDDPDEGGLGVNAGISHLEQDMPGDAFQDSVVVSARIHPEWNPDYVQTAGDLAVLTLDPPLDLDGVTAKAIALPPDQPIGSEPVLVGATVLVSGYGRQLGGTRPSGQLFSLESYVDRPSVCPADDNAAALCVRTPAGAACSGDSGGPLVTRTNPPILVGVVSNGPAGCPPAEGESYVNLAVPENRRFLAGAANPPIAPREIGILTFMGAGGQPVVGGALVCDDDFTGSPTTRWKVKSDTGVTVGSGTGGASFTYRPTDADAGHTLSCEVTASNPGGVAYAGPAVTGAVRAVAKDPARPDAPLPFRLSEAVLTATAAKTVKRGKVLRVDVTLASLFNAAETGTVCVKQDTAKPKCVTSNLKAQAGTTLVFRFRISKRAKAKSLQKFAVTAALAGQNPNSRLLEQVSRSMSLRARVSR